MILNVFGGTERKNQPWDARYASPVITLAGSTELDFRNAQLPEGETSIVILGLLGNVDLTVPDDLPVLVSGISVLGDRRVFGQSTHGIAHGTDVATPEFESASGRRLRLTVYTGLGNLEVQRIPSTSTVGTTVS